MHKHINVDDIRSQFPVLNRMINGKKLCYLDNAATTQKPQVVIDAITNYYSNNNANVHRGTHTLSQEATALYEGAREKIKSYINAASNQEVIFTSGVTDGINLIANSFSYSLQPNDEILISALEHHSNIVPWQFLQEKVGVKINIVPFDENTDIEMDKLINMLTPQTKLLAISHVSNAFGTVNPIKKIIDIAHKNNTLVMVDGAQASGHLKIDMQDLDCDFYVMSAHKMFGPTGVGIVYGKEKLLEEMHPFKGGGDMISHVAFDKTEFNELPYKFEAGTPNISAVVGFGAAVDFMQAVEEKIGLAKVGSHENELLNLAKRLMGQIDGITLLGNANEQIAAQSFVVDGVHSLDLATILDEDGIAVRAGHHCAMPALDILGYSGSLRMSLAMYNTEGEINRFVESLASNISLIR